MTNMLNEVLGITADDLLCSIGLQRRRGALDYIVPAVQWLMVGAVIGGGVALLLAPSTGEDLRGQLNERLQTAREKAREAAANIRARGPNGRSEATRSTSA